MPPMRISSVNWSANTFYSTRRASIEEIEHVRRNLRGRAATHVATGRTAAGRMLTVAFIYSADGRTATPINAWDA